MTDLSKCEGIINNKDCPIRDKCVRYNAETDEHWQSYIETYYDFYSGTCEMFWEDIDAG